MSAKQGTAHWCPRCTALVNPCWLTCLVCHSSLDRHLDPENRIERVRPKLAVERDRLDAMRETIMTELRQTGPLSRLLRYKIQDWRKQEEDWQALSMMIPKDPV